MANTIPVKPWWQSKTVWAACATAVVTGLSAYFGAENPWVAIVTAAFSALGIYGRMTATTTLK